MPQQEILMIEDIIRNIIREELEKFLGPKQTTHSDGSVETVHPEGSVVVVENFLSPDFGKQSEKTVEMFDDTPVKQTVEVNNTADLMSELKQLVADKGAGTGAKAKKILVSHFDYSKFSEVPDDEAQTVYNKVAEEL